MTKDFRELKKKSNSILILTDSILKTLRMGPTLKSCLFPITRIAKNKSSGRPVKLFLPYSN